MPRTHARPREVYRMRKAAGTCVHCSELAAPGRSRCERHLTLSRKAHHKPLNKNDRKAYWDGARIEVLNAYGGCCACCGETEWMLLTMDHKNIDGKQHRLEIGTGSHALYSWLRKNKYPKEFQVLCHNCNFGRHRNGGVCPHVASAVTLFRVA